MNTNSNNESGFNTAILVVFGFGITAFVFWYYLGDVLMALAFIFSAWQFKVYPYLPLIPADVKEEMRQLAQMLPHMKPENYDLSYFFHLWSLCGYGLRLFLVPWMLYLAFSLPKHAKRFSYRRRLSLDALVAIQAKSVYSVAPIKGLKLHREHPHIGPWHIAPNPLHFALKHGLLYYKSRDKLRSLTPDECLLDLESKREILPDYRYVTFNQQKADALHTNQLGSPWRGTGGLSPYPPMYILAAAFMARVAGGEEGLDDYHDLMGTVVFSSTNPEWNKKTGKITKPAAFDVKGAMTIARKLIGKYESNRYVQRCLKQHGFDITVLMGLLQTARDRSGKLPASEFLWLRPINRRLWMALSQVGGDTGEVEAHGPWAHYSIEKKYGKAIGTPVIEGASDALELHLSKEQWLTTDLEDPEKAQRDRMISSRNKKPQTAASRAGAFGTAFAAKAGSK